MGCADKILWGGWNVRQYDRGIQKPNCRIQTRHRGLEHSALFSDCHKASGGKCIADNNPVKVLLRHLRKERTFSFFERKNLLCMCKCDYENVRSTFKVIDRPFDNLIEIEQWA